MISAHFSSHSSHHLTTSVSNGDDASVHQIPAGYELVVSTDTALSGRHWPENFPLDDAMDRAVCAALSDLAAMGAKACWLWTAITLQHQGQAKLIGEGIRRAASRHAVEIAGGDTTCGQSCAITVTVAGVILAGSAMRRDQAHIGDNVFIVGALGQSALGLAAWQAGQYGSNYAAAFDHITPQLSAGEALSQAGIRCCIDVSDGLLQDANHLCRASHCAMQLNITSLPDYHALKKNMDADTLIQAMLTGGDDYALLFTAAPSMIIPDVGAVHIGQCITAKNAAGCISIPLIDHQPYPMPHQRGFNHFA